jgi:hypothetical protein
MDANATALGIAAGAVGTIALDVVSYRSSARGLQPSGGGESRRGVGVVVTPTG